MSVLWYLNRARKERGRVDRMMCELPIYPVHTRNAPPSFPPLKVYPYRDAPRHRCDALLIALAALIALLILIDTAGGSLAEDQPTTMYVCVDAGSWLNGRYSPDKYSSVEARFQAGDEVDVYEVSGQWAKVKGGECGYVWCNVGYLSDTAPGSDPEEYTVSSNGRVRVHKTPDGELVRWVHDGDTVSVQFVIDGWAYVGDGYVAEEYLEEESK